MLNVPVRGESASLDLVNTTYVRGGSRGHLVDALPGPDALTEWLETEPEARVEVGPEIDLKPGSFARVMRVRQVLRESYRQATDPTADLDAEMVAEINAGMRLAQTWRELERPGSTRRVWNNDQYTDRLIAWLMRDATTLLGENPLRVHACTAPGCILYFLPSGRRKYCSQSCATRVRVARHHRSESGRPL